MDLKILAYLLVTVVYSVALPSVDLHEKSLRTTRQDASPVCTEDNDCHPDTMGPVSMELARCVDGMCECNDCFMLHPDTQLCFTCEDYPFNLTTATCGEDVRQDQRRAFFLSFFLSSTGAANFYIKVYGLAVGQLIVLIIFVVSVIILICPCCICCGCIGKEGAIKGTCLFLLLFVLAIVFALVMGLVIISWWVGELTIFANNERMTGNGCFPRPNL